MRLFLGNSWRACTNGATNLNSASILTTRSLPRRSRIPATPLVDFFAEQRIGWQLELAAEKGITFGNIDAIVEHVQQRLASHQPQPSLCMAIYGRRTARLALTAPISSIQPAIGATENAIWRCCRCIPISHRRFMTAISPFRRYRWIFSTGSRFTSSTPCLIGQGCLAVSTRLLRKSDGSAACGIGTAHAGYGLSGIFSLHEA